MATGHLLTKLTALTDDTHAVFWQCCMDAVQLVGHTGEGWVKIRGMRQSEDGHVQVRVTPGHVFVVGCTGGDRMLTSCLIRHASQLCGCDTVRYASSELEVPRRDTCFCVRPLFPRRLCVEEKLLDMTREQLELCETFIRQPYTQQHLAAIHMMQHSRHRPEQEEALASLVLQCVHPLTTRSAHVITMVSLFLNTLTHLPPHLVAAKQLLRAWAAVARSFICHRCVDRGVTAVPPRALAKRHKQHVTMVVVQCCACQSVSVACVATLVKIDPTFEWWMRSCSTTKTWKQSCTWPELQQHLHSAAEPAQFGSGLAETPSQTPLPPRA